MRHIRAGRKGGRDATFSEQTREFGFHGGLDRWRVVRRNRQAVENKTLDVNGDIHPTAAIAARSGLAVLSLPVDGRATLGVPAVVPTGGKLVAVGDDETPAAVVPSAVSCQRKSASLI